LRKGSGADNAVEVVAPNQRKRKRKIRIKKRIKSKRKSKSRTGGRLGHPTLTLPLALNPLLNPNLPLPLSPLLFRVAQARTAT
jgi:hypothetical protein